MKKYIGFFLITITLLQTIQASDNILTVNKALKVAREKNPGINQLRQQIEEKNAEWWSSLGLADPQILYTKEGIELNSNQGFAERRWTISQSIDFPLTSYFRLKKLGMEEEALRNQLQAACLVLKADIKSNYTELAYALEIMHLRQEQLEISNQLRNAALTRLEVGESTGLDLMKADILLAESHNEMDEARRVFHEARYTLFNIIGLDPEEQKYQISFPDTLEYVEIYVDQKTALATLDKQPEYFSISKKMVSAEYGVDEAWTDFLPQIDLSYYRQNYGQGFDHYGYELGVSIPLWFPLNQRGKIQIAQARKRFYQWELKNVSLDLKKRLEIAWHSYEVSKEAIERFHLQVRIKAAQLRDLTLEGYLVGEIDQLTLLEAQRTYLNSEKSYFDVLRKYYLRLIELEKFLQKDLVYTNEPYDCNP